MRKTGATTVAALALGALLVAPMAMAQPTGQAGGMPMKAGQMQKMQGQMGKGGAGMAGKGGMGMMGGQAGAGGMGMMGMRGGMGMKGGMGGMRGMMMGGMMKRMRAMMMAGMLKRAKPLSAKDVRRIIDGHLSMMGLSKLSARNVKIVDDKTSTADVVAPKGEVIMHLKVNRRMGRMMIVE